MGSKEMWQSWKNLPRSSWRSSSLKSRYVNLTPLHIVRDQMDTMSRQKKC